MGFKDKFKEFQSISVSKSIMLRQVDLEKDLKQYYNIYNSPNVFRYYEGGKNGFVTQETIAKILSNQIKEFEKAKIYSWTITNGENSALGRILLSDFDANNKIANIGYFIGEDSWGKGIISACIKSVVVFGFSFLKLERIYTTVHVDNIASWKALEKNGFIREGLTRHCFDLPSGLSDCYIYAKLYTD